MQIRVGRSQNASAILAKKAASSHANDGATIPTHSEKMLSHIIISSRRCFNTKLAQMRKGSAHLLTRLIAEFSSLIKKSHIKRVKTFKVLRLNIKKKNSA